MSGICAVFHRDGRPVDRENLYGMLQAMAHRGPHGSDLWYEGPAGLAHTMLHTTPESLDEKLPYVDPDSRLAITADARIDNREELFSRLSISRDLRRTLPDSQLILRAYLKWQQDCVHYLLGDFAFIIWDMKRRSLFCARDHLGLKPFYYSLSNNMFVSASETNAIVQMPQIKKQINEARIADYLVNELEGIDKTTTFYNDIYRLPPAHLMVITRDNVKIKTYWEPDGENEIRFNSDSEYVEAFSEIFTDSVRARLRCNTTPGLMLSGGVDSSSIISIAQQVKHEFGIDRLPVYSVISNDGNTYSDKSKIKSILNYAEKDFDPFQIDINNLDDYGLDLESVLDKNAEPFDAMTMIIAIYLMARSHNRNVVIDGVEGDAIHSASMFYPAYYLKNRQWLKAYSEINMIWKNYYQSSFRFLNIFISVLIHSLVTDSMRRLKRKYYTGYQLRKSIKDSNINIEFAREVGIVNRLKQLRMYHYTGGDVVSREYHKSNILHPYITVGIERYERVAALCSIEARHPLLDKRLVDFSLGVPWEQKVRAGWSKYMLRRASSEYLPQEVIWSRGWGDYLGWPVTKKWIQSHYQSMIELISSQKMVLEKYIDDSSLKQVLCPGFRIDNNSFHKLWDMYLLANWIRSNDKNFNQHQIKKVVGIN